MAIYRNDIVSQAKAWIGCKESNGSHKKIIDLYNTQKNLPRSYKVQYHDHWCAAFVSAVAIKCKATSIMPTECGCEQMIKKYKKLGRWVEKDLYVPKPGDIIFYDWNDSGVGDCTGWSDHVGIVEKVMGKLITVIEGNNNNAVKRREIQVGARYIRGYGVPDYDGASAPKANTTTKKKTVSQIAKEVINGDWGNGDARKKKLEAAGYDYAAVQKKVNELLS